MFRAPNTDTDCSELPRPTHICTPDTQPERKPMVLDHVPGQWESFIIDKSKQTNVFMPGDIINNNTELELQDLKTVKHNDTHVQIQWDCQSHKAFICNTPIDQPRPGTQSCCVACSPGTIRKNGACVACPAGRFMENIDIQRDNHKTYVFTHQIEIVKNNESIQWDNGSCEPLCDQLSCNCNGLKCNITECMKCPSGKYQDLPQQARCKFCESNTFQPNEGAEDCELCPPGSYSYFSVSRKGEPIEQKNYCTIKETTCPNNQVFARAANMCVDRNLCPPGSIFDDNTRSCVECTTPGTFAALDNTCASISEVCECTSACQSTTLKRGFEFKGIYNAISKTCEPDCISIGATVYNYTIRSCQCKNGQGISRGNCNTCQVGQFSANSECVLCELGKYQDQTGQTRCTQCPDGKFADTFGTVRCKLCQVYQKSSADRQRCTLCGNNIEEDKRNNRRFCDTECNVCGKECPSATFADQKQSREAVCVDLCPDGKYLTEGDCTNCPLGKYRTQFPPIIAALAPNVQYGCIHCPLGKFQDENDDDFSKCKDSIPHSEVSGINAPTTVTGLYEITNKCTNDETECDDTCGLSSTDQTEKVANGVFAAEETFTLNRKQPYYRFGNYYDGFSQWVFVADHETQKCIYATCAGARVPAFTRTPFCQLLPNSAHVDDMSVCGDVGQDRAVAINTYSREECRRCEWPYIEENGNCVFPILTDKYFPGFERDTTGQYVSGIGPAIHKGNKTQCPDYARMTAANIGVLDGMFFAEIGRAHV